MKSEFKQLKSNVARVHQQLEIEVEVAEQFKDFLEVGISFRSMIYIMYIASLF